MPPYIEPFVKPVMDPVAQTAIAAVLLLILLDFVVGMVGALVTHTFSSQVMREGLLHKFTELICVALAIILDGALTGGLDLTMQPVLMATCVYVGIMETGSVLELVKKYNPDAEGLVGWLTGFVTEKERVDDGRS